MHELLEYVHENLALNDPGLVGCRRRGNWSKGEKPNWRFLRGNAILEFVGDRDGVKTPCGPLTFYMDEGKLLQFRGGKWNLDWVEDFYDLWSLISVYYPGDHFQISRTILVLHENRGELDVKEVEVPENLNPEHRVESMLAEYTSNPPGRISKSGPRAVRLCLYCPHKVRCDAEDKLQGQTDDWSPSYPQP